MAEATEPPKQIKISVFTPIIYVAVLLGIFVLFARSYRRNRLSKLTRVEPIFEQNFPQLLFSFLKERAQDPAQEGPDVKVLQAALFRRASEAIRRALKLKENEPIYNRLYQEGLIGEEVFQQFEFQSKFQEMEIKEIAEECEAMQEGWSQTFFPVAQEICFNEALRRRLHSMDGRSKDLASMWDLVVEEKEKIIVNFEQKPAPEKVTEVAKQAAPKEVAPKEVAPKDAAPKVVAPVAAASSEGSTAVGSPADTDDASESNTAETAEPKKAKKKKGGKNKKK